MKLLKILLVISVLLNILFISQFAYKHHINNKIHEIEEKVYSHLKKEGVEAFDYTGHRDFKLQEPMKYNVFVRLYNDPREYQFFINKNNKVEVLGVQDTDGVYKTAKEVKNSAFDDHAKYIRKK